MNNVSLTYLPYTLDLIKPFETARGTITQRKGFIIELKSPGGKRGLGDAAPFPEFGSETYEEAQLHLENIQLKLNVDVNRIKESLEENLFEFTPYPALRHGMEQAILYLISDERNIVVNRLLNLPLRKNIDINGVIGHLSPEDSANAAAALVDEGYKTIKMKCGRENFSDDLEAIKEVRNRIGNEIKLRIDINGRWEAEDAKKYLNLLEEFNLEYVEQPVETIEEMIELKQSSSVPIAADESVRKLKFAKKIIEKNAADYLILKPMLLGGLLPTLDIIKLASQNGIRSVVTSSFESAIGKSLAVFAAATIDDDIAHGLSTASFIKKDLIEDPYPVKNGTISIF
jgi:L-Ala-D/L-Glu epimerase